MAQVQSPPPADELNLGWALLRTLLVLAAVVALAFLSLNFGLRKLMGLTGVRTGGPSVVQVLERIPLDPKRSLYLVQAAGEYLLLGGGEEALSFLAKLDAAEVERLRKEKAAESAAAGPFLQKLLSKRGGPPPPTA